MVRLTLPMAVVFLLLSHPAQAEGNKRSQLRAKWSRWSTLQGQMEGMVGQLKGLDHLSRKDAEKVMGRFTVTLASAASRFNRDRVSPDGATRILQEGLLNATSHVYPTTKIGRERENTFRAAETLIAAIRHTQTRLPYLRRTTKRLDNKGETQGLTAGEYKRLKVSKSEAMGVQMRNTVYARQKANHLFKLPTTKGKQLPSWRHPIRSIRAMRKN